MQHESTTPLPILYTEFGLKELVHLNYTLYCNTQVARILNRPEVLPHQALLDANNSDNLPSFSHHTEKTEYVNSKLKKGGLVPVSLVLYKLNLELIDLQQQQQQQQHLESTQADSHFRDGSLKTVRKIAKQFEENNITHWYQIVHPQTQQVMTLEELNLHFGISFNKYTVPSWEKIVSSVTDPTHKLLPQYQRPTTSTDPNCSNLLITLERMPAKDSPSTQFVFTDGSVRECGVAVSAAFFEDDNPHNKAFRTVGPQTIFNAEAQAAEYGLYVLSISDTVVVTDSKSLVSTITKLKNLVSQNRILLPSTSNLQDLQSFASNIMYKYRKSHRYSSILQSILVQILLREAQGFQTSFVHVYSHLLDHIYMPFKKNQMKKELRENRTELMKKKYGAEKALFYMEGNFRADRLCEELPSSTIHVSIQKQSASPFYSQRSNQQQLCIS